MNRREFVADGVAALAIASSILRSHFSDAFSAQSLRGLGRILKINAKPAPIDIDTEKTAIIVVDM